MHCRFSVVTMVLLLGAMPLAHAQQANDQAQQAMARAQALLRQVAQEKALIEAEVAKLRAENSKLKKDVKRTTSDLENASADLASASREASGVRARLGRTESRLEKTTSQLQEVVAKYRAQAAALRKTEAEREALKTNLDATSRQLADAEKKNLALYQLNKKILAEFEQEGPWDGLLRKEPFTGIKRVEIENLVQDYEYEMGAHVRDANIEATTTPAAP